MRSWILLGAVVTLCACGGDDSGPCLTKGAVREQGVCECPEGFHTLIDECVASDAEVSIAPNTADDGGRAGGHKTPDATVALSDAARTLDSSVGYDKRDEDAALANDKGDGALRNNSPAVDGADDAATALRDANAERPESGTATMPGGCVPSVPSTEVCDGKDNDCNGTADDGAKNECGMACSATCPPACVPTAEVCDGKDNDCDGSIDNPVAWYPDCDSDGYGTLAGKITACAQPTGVSCVYTRSVSPPDCDDASAARRPGAEPLVSAGDPVSLLKLDTYSGDTNCDGNLQRLATDFLNDTGTQINGLDVVPCTASGACGGGKACYRIEGKADGTLAGCGNTRVTMMAGGGSAGCLVQDGILRVICQ